MICFLQLLTPKALIGIAPEETSFEIQEKQRNRQLGDEELSQVSFPTATYSFWIENTASPVKAQGKTD